MPDANDLVREAQTEIGYQEWPPNSNKTKFAEEAGHANGQPWCATFIVAICRRVGIQLPSESAYTPTMAQGFKNIGAWGKTPRPGAIAFFDFPDKKFRIQHVGIVTGTSIGSVTTIEGNTAAGISGSQDNGGGVWPKHRSLAQIVGFGYPAFDPTPQPVPIEEDELATPEQTIIRDNRTQDAFLCLPGLKPMQITSQEDYASAKNAGVLDFEVAGTDIEANRK